jgi:hypothetical protein
MFVFLIVFVGLFFIAKTVGESDQAIAGEAFRGKSLDLSRLSADKVALYHYATYAKEAGHKRVRANDFWQIVVSSNIVQKDLFNSPNFSSDKYISAMDNAFRGNYREFKGLYSAIYSGVGQKKIV